MVTKGQMSTQVRITEMAFILGSVLVPTAAVAAEGDTTPGEVVERWLSLAEATSACIATCSLPPGHESVTTIADVDGAALSALIDGDTLYLATGCTEGEAVVYFPEKVSYIYSWYETGTAERSIVRCNAEITPYVASPGIVRGVVLDTNGSPAAWVDVLGCGGATRTNDEGLFHLKTAYRNCSLTAFRTDGTVKVPSEPANVQPSHGAVAPVTLTIDHREHGGVGVVIESVLKDGRWVYVISEVLPGSPASDSGITPGDVITSIDGVPPPAGADIWRLGTTGPVGTGVVLTLENEHEHKTLHLTRSPL